MEPPDDAAQSAGDQQTFDRAQAEKILGRAATLQLAASDDELSLAELTEAAADAGIERALVLRAARELAPQRVTTPDRFGIKTQVVRRRWLSTTLDRAGFERTLARLDAFFGALGERSISDHSASWSARHIHVTLEHRDSGTVVQVSERFVNTTNNLVGASGVIGGVTGLASGAVLAKALALGMMAPVAIVPMIAACAALGLWGARRHITGLVDKAGVDFDKALDTIEEACAASPPAELPESPDQ